MIICRLSKAGYGSLNSLLHTRTDLVMDAYHFEIFSGEFESEMVERFKAEK